jgi:hypothetical protein
MDAFSASDLRKLTADQKGPCVTIYLPTHPLAANGQQDALRLKNLVNEAERKLTDQGQRAPDAKQLLAPLRSLPADSSFWDRRSHGLALFLAEGVLHRYRVPLAFEEAVVVNRRFQVRPLLPLLATDDRFLVLALSQKQVRFFEGTRYGLKEVVVEGLPSDLTSALNYDAAHRGHPVNPSGSKAGWGHGQGAERDTAKEDLAHYFRLVDTALKPMLRDQRVPLVLAAVQYLLPIYREVASYPHLADVALPGNPEHLGEQQLFERTWPLVQPLAERAQQDAAAKYRQFAGTGKTSCDARQILAAAFAGQVESLFVDPAAQVWGRFDPATNHIEVRDGTGANDDDLLDLAAVQTLLSRGTVFAVPPARSPAPPIAAVFRY